MNMPRNALAVLADALDDMAVFRRTEQQRAAEAAERRRLEDELRHRNRRRTGSGHSSGTTKC